MTPGLKAKPSIPARTVSVHTQYRTALARPRKQALIDSHRVVFKDQEMADIDDVAYGNSNAFDVNQPGHQRDDRLLFVRPPLATVRVRSVTREERRSSSAISRAWSFRSAPAGGRDDRSAKGAAEPPPDLPPRPARSTRHTLSSP
jgi:hypothetical protein